MKRGNRRGVKVEVIRTEVGGIKRVKKGGVGLGRKVKEGDKKEGLEG